MTGLYRAHSACTHVGRVRKVNEDSILLRPDIALWAVSDGMGGHAGGDFASQSVVEALNRLPDGLEPAEVMREARRALHESHDRVRQEADLRDQGTIGATIVLLVLSDEHFMCLWVGDSRLYRLREGSLSMISFDHSVVGEMVEQGQMTWDEAENCSFSNQITRAVGVGDALEIDKRRGDVLPGDRFLLCSDGLSRYANEETLCRLMMENPIETLADKLLALTLDAGAADNVSVIAVEI